MSHKRSQNHIAESRIALPLTIVYGLAMSIFYGAWEQQLWMQTIVLAISTLLMAELNNSNSLIRIFSRMVSCSFLFMSVMAIFLLHSMQATIVQLCFIAFYLSLFKAYQNPRATGWVYYAFFAIGMASVVFIQILYFVPIMWILMIFNILAFGSRSFVASLLGLITPFTMFITQDVDVKNPNIGKFKQRVIVCHVGFDRPTILVTEGYFADYALNKSYQDELSKLLNANVIFVEYRYFGQSVPQPCNWDYLTVENSMYDLHHINQTFHQIYKNKWIATGISKGGQTTMFYRTFFPDDVAISVPYVAPLNKSLEDGRHEPFLSKIVSNSSNRQHVKDFQMEVLKRKSQLLPYFKQYCQDRRLTFRLPIEEVYDYVVLEYAFAIWQWGTPMSDIPTPEASDSALIRNLIIYSEPNYFSEQSVFLPFNVQAVRELGYYGYDTKPFKKYLSIKTAKDYMHKLMLPAEFSKLKFDKTLYKKTKKFLKKNDPRMMYIYGGIDPWGASGVADMKFLRKKRNIKVHVLPTNCFRDWRQRVYAHRLQTEESGLGRQHITTFGS